MFVIYGDPESSNPPIFSVRTAAGHSPPAAPASVYPSPDFDIRMISSAWQRPSASSNYSRSTYIASVTFVCLDCYNWTGTKIDPMSAEQPWIWAWNEDQVFTEFWDEASLAPHGDGARQDGAGTFSVDMRMPPLEVEPTAQTEDVIEISQLDSSLDTDGRGYGHLFSKSTMWTFHGVTLGFAFLILFPAGTVAIRRASAGAFRYHWVLQLLGTILMTIGATIGLILHPRLHNLHHLIGIFILILAWFQALLGWRHHVRFLRVFRRNWFSSVHIGLGRLLLLCGCVNILLGVTLRRRDKFMIELLFVIIVFDLMGVVYWVLSVGENVPESTTWRFQPLRNMDHFTIGQDDDDDHDHDEDEDERSAGMPKPRNNRHKVSISI
jgi:hypothetical protein